MTIHAHLIELLLLHMDQVASAAVAAALVVVVLVAVALVVAEVTQAVVLVDIDKSNKLKFTRI